MLETFGCATAVEMPSLPYQLVRFRDFQAVAELRPVDDARAELAQAPADLADGDVHRMSRDHGAFPALGDHLLVTHGVSAVAEQHAKRGERLRPEPDRLAVAQESGRAEIEAEWSEDDFRHGVR